MSGIELDLRPDELLAHWSRCGMTADWLASYLTSELAAERRAAARSVLSTVANELLENAVKFCCEPAGRIRLAGCHDGQGVRVETWNRATKERAELLETTLNELERASPQRLFTQRMAEGRTPEAAGIGVIIIRRDHGARIRAELTPRTDGTVDVHVSVDLDLSGIQP